jgi:hypothetical protein
MAKASYISAASTSAAVIQAGDTRLMHFSAYNNGTGAAYVRFFAGGATTAPTAGSGTPVWRVMVPAGGGVVEHLAAGDATGLMFRSGLGFTATGGAADSDTTALAANQLTLNVWFE